jgi:outer membrane protein
MSRKFIIEQYLYKLIFLFCLGIFFISGCAQPESTDSYSAGIVKSRDLHEIETLELQKKEVEEPKPAEANVPAPEKVELTLEQCRALALENNLDLKIQLINPAIAAERISQEEARFEAAFSGSTTFVKNNTPVASTLDISGSNVEYMSSNLGVSMPLRTGGTVSFNAVDNRTKTDSSYSIFNPSYSSDLSASISQPLLRNAGNRNSTYAIQIAQYDYKISNAATKLEAIRVITDIDRYYWRLYSSRKELEVRKQWYDHAVALQEQAQRLYDAGQSAQVEIIRAQAGVAQRLQAIITSENNVRLRERDLKRALNKAGMEMNTPTVLVIATEPDPVLYELESERLIKTALGERMEMLELELQIAQDIITQGYLENQALPLVTFDYTYNINGIGSSRNDSFDLLQDKRFEDHRLGLNLSVPLGNGAAKSRIQQAFLQRRQRLTTKESRTIMIEYEVLNAIDQIEANWQRILAARQSSILYGRLSEAESRQFELGYVTSTNVLEAQNNLADAQSSEIIALVDYQISLVDLAYATGTVFGEAKIRWESLDQENIIK